MCRLVLKKFRREEWEKKNENTKTLAKFGLLLVAVLAGGDRNDVVVNCDGKVVVGFDSSSDSDIAKWCWRVVVAEIRNENG